MMIENKLKLLRLVSVAFGTLSVFMTAYMLSSFVQTGSFFDLGIALINGLAVYMNIKSIRKINAVLEPVKVPVTIRNIVRRD